MTKERTIKVFEEIEEFKEPLYIWQDLTIEEKKKEILTALKSSSSYNAFSTLNISKKVVGKNGTKKDVYYYLFELLKENKCNKIYEEYWWSTVKYISLDIALDQCDLFNEKTGELVFPRDIF